MSEDNTTKEQREEVCKRMYLMYDDAAIDLRKYLQKTHPELTEEEIDNLIWDEERERYKRFEEERKRQPKQEPSEFCKFMMELNKRIGEDKGLTFYTEIEGPVIDRYPDLKEGLENITKKCQR